mgnify:CR=1 FL=1
MTKKSILGLVCFISLCCLDAPALHASVAALGLRSDGIIVKDGKAVISVSGSSLIGPEPYSVKANGSVIASGLTASELSAGYEIKLDTGALYGIQICDGGLPEECSEAVSTDTVSVASFLSKPSLAGNISLGLNNKNIPFMRYSWTDGMHNYGIIYKDSAAALTEDGLLAESSSVTYSCARNSYCEITGLKPNAVYYSVVRSSAPLAYSSGPYDTAVYYQAADLFVSTVTPSQNLSVKDAFASEGSEISASVYWELSAEDNVPDGYLLEIAKAELPVSTSAAQGYAGYKSQEGLWTDSGSTVTVSGLDTNTLYHYRLSSINSAGRLSNTAGTEGSVYIGGNVPGTSEMSVYVSSAVPASAGFSWTTPTDGGSDGTVSYKAQICADSGCVSQVCTLQNAESPVVFSTGTCTGLTADTAYHFRLISKSLYDGGTYYRYSDTVAARTYPAKVAITAKDIIKAPQSFTLNVTENPAQADYFRLEVLDRNTYSVVGSSTVSDFSSETMTVSGLTLGSTYILRFYSGNESPEGSGQETVSDDIELTTDNTSTVSGLTIDQNNISSHTVSIAFNYSYEADHFRIKYSSDSTNWNVYYSSFSEAGYDQPGADCIRTNGETVCESEIKDLNPNTWYYFKVYPVWNTNLGLMESAYSQSEHIYTRPAELENFYITSSTDSIDGAAVTLNWDKITSSSAAYIFYSVSEDKEINNEDTPINITDYSGGISQYTVRQLKPNTAYYISAGVYTYLYSTGTASGADIYGGYLAHQKGNYEADGTEWNWPGEEISEDGTVISTVTRIVTPPHEVSDVYAEVTSTGSIAVSWNSGQNPYTEYTAELSSTGFSSGTLDYNIALSENESAAALFTGLPSNVKFALRIISKHNQTDSGYSVINSTYEYSGSLITALSDMKSVSAEIVSSDTFKIITENDEGVNTSTYSIKMSQCSDSSCLSSSLFLSTYSYIFSGDNISTHTFVVIHSTEEFMEKTGLTMTGNTFDSCKAGALDLNSCSFTDYNGAEGNTTYTCLQLVNNALYKVETANLDIEYNPSAAVSATFTALPALPAAYTTQSEAFGDIQANSVRVNINLSDDTNIAATRYEVQLATITDSSSGDSACADLGDENFAGKTLFISTSASAAANVQIPRLYTYQTYAARIRALYNADSSVKSAWKYIPVCTPQAEESLTRYININQENNINVATFTYSYIPDGATDYSGSETLYFVFDAPADSLTNSARLSWRPVFSDSGTANAANMEEVDGILTSDRSGISWFDTDTEASASSMTRTGIGLEVTKPSNVNVRQGINITIPVNVNWFPESGSNACYTKGGLMTETCRNRLVLAHYDSSDEVWTALTTNISESGDGQIIYVSGVTYDLSSFQIMMTQDISSSDLSQIKIYPNPYKPNSFSGKMNFENIPTGSKIRIYTFLGELVSSFEAGVGNKAEWDGTNKKGSKAASGVYLVLIKTPDGTKKTMKVALER